MSDTQTCLAGLPTRVLQYCQAAAEVAKGWYDAEGNWLLSSKPAETRERMWLCCALYQVDEAAFADAILRPAQTNQYGAVRFNIFDTNIAAALLSNCAGQMADDVRTKLEGLVRDGFSFKPGNRQPDYQFHGYNDNMPAKATMGLILGGEYLDCSDAVEYGLWNLRQFRAMLVRNGINSEFNSPTYSPLTLHAMSEIAEHARHPEARAIARGIEERLWLDLAARFHPELGVISGPYARAYTIDTLAQVSCVASLLHFVLGEGVHPSPMNFFQPDAHLVLHHKGDLPFNIAQMCWYTLASYHVPALAQELFTKKRYPYHAVATCEQGAGGADFPARRCRIETLLTTDYTLGTATTALCGGEQTMSYFVTYRKTSPVRSYADIGTVFTKLVVDDDVPGMVKHAMDMPAAGAEWGQDGAVGVPIIYTNSGEDDCLTSHANTVTLQAESTALVLTHPHLSLGGDADTGQGATPLSRLSEFVIFPTHFSGTDEIIVGGVPRASWEGTAQHGEWIACRRGRLLIAVRPMAYSCVVGDIRFTLESLPNYDVIRTTFYQGVPRTFTRAELRMIFGGFVAEHASVDEYPSLQAFVDALSASKFTDYFWSTRRTRYRRPADRVRPALELESSLSPGSPAARIAAINGQTVTWPTLAYDDIANESLPFLNEPFASVPAFFPWDDFSVEWGDWPYAIGDREDN
ncbi:MAG TPA: hypothetical protein VGL77_04830 [Armatimonadota bacterium]|jgi:hypothetical protein